MIGNRPRSNPSAGRGGSRTLTYVLLAIVAFFVIYYLIVPAFFPPGRPVTHTGPVISMSPSADLSGTTVTFTGRNLTASSNATATFGAQALSLTGTCKTTSAGDLEGCSFVVPKLASGAYNVTVTAGATSASAHFTIPQYSPPVSTVIVSLTSVGLGLVTQLVTRKVVDLNKERRMRAEVNAFNKEKREATVKGDKVKLEKLKKRELQMRQEQAKVSTARFKVTAITFIPLLAVYYLMSSFLGGFNVLVAYSAIPLPLVVAPFGATTYGWVSLFWWYFLSSFTFSTMLGKLLHTTP